MNKTTNLPFTPDGNVGAEQQISRLRFELENLKGDFEEFKKSQNINVVSTYNGMNLSIAFRHMTSRYYKVEHFTLTNVSNLAISQNTLIAEFELPKENAGILAPIALSKLQVTGTTGSDIKYLTFYFQSNKIYGTYSVIGSTYNLNGSITVVF